MLFALITCRPSVTTLLTPFGADVHCLCRPTCAIIRLDMKRKKSLAEKYPPSEACTCRVCVGYCRRPGWWTVEEAARAIKAGYASRMMLEMSPDRSFGVLAPAFRGCEVQFAMDEYAGRGCTFFKEQLCELHGT